MKTVFLQRKATVEITKARVSPDAKNIGLKAPYTIMIPVPGGIAALGTESSVTISNFQIGKYEVTQQRWMQVMGSWPSRELPIIPMDFATNCLFWLTAGHWEAFITVT